MSMEMPMPMSPSVGMFMPDHMAAMHMSFFWGKDAVVLFSGWPGYDRLGMYILALAAVFLLAVVAEVLKVAPRLKPRGLTAGAAAAIHSGVYGVRMTVAYLIMLSVMSFNVGIFIAAVSGHAVGWFFVKYRALTAVGGGADPEL